MMSKKTADIANILLYYVVAPILVMEFLLSDLGLLTFTWVIYAVSIAVLAVLIGIVFVYKKKNPEYDFKANDLYTKLLVLVLIFECLWSAGIFNP